LADKDFLKVRRLDAMLGGDWNYPKLTYGLDINMDWIISGSPIEKGLCEILSVGGHDMHHLVAPCNLICR